MAIGNCVHVSWFHDLRAACACAAGVPTGPDEAVAHAGPQQRHQAACHAGLRGRLQQVGECGCPCALLLLIRILAIQQCLDGPIHVFWRKKQGVKSYVCTVCCIATTKRGKLVYFRGKCCSGTHLECVSPSCLRWLTWATTRTRGQYFWRRWTQRWLQVVQRYRSSTKTVSHHEFNLNLVGVYWFSDEGRNTTHWTLYFTV